MNMEMSSGIRQGVVMWRDTDVTKQIAASILKAEGLPNIGAYLPDYVARTS
jgi:hypothetical protein